MNEAFTYVFCLFMVYFSASETSPANRATLGLGFIVIFIFWLVLNFYLIVRQALYFIKLLLKRSYYQASIQRLHNNVEQVTQNLKISVRVGESLIKPVSQMGLKASSIGSDDGVLVFEQKMTKYGGSICEISVKRASEVEFIPDSYGLAEQRLIDELGLEKPYFEPSSASPRCVAKLINEDNKLGTLNKITPINC